MFDIISCVFITICLTAYGVLVGMRFAKITDNETFCEVAMALVCTIAGDLRSPLKAILWAAGIIVPLLLINHFVAIPVLIAINVTFYVIALIIAVCLHHNQGVEYTTPFNETSTLLFSVLK